MPAQEFLKDKLRFIFLALAVVFCCLLLLFQAPAWAEVWHQSNGNSEDVNPPLVGPVYDLGGGGTDVDFPWPALKGTIVDTHFYQKDRMGRAMAFVARLLRDGITPRALAIGIDEGTSLVINRQGMAQVMANERDGSAYLILGDHQPEVCERNKPISFSNYRIWRVRNGQTFDLKNIPATDYYQVSVKRGRISSIL